MMSNILLLLSVLGSIVSAKSSVAVFKEGTCSQSLDNYNGPNGYPDGLCSPLHLKPEQSFQVIDLDPGCSVTIYGNNSEAGSPCSSTTLQVAQFAECYNSSWIYYSIDGCDVPSQIPSSSSSAASSSTATSSATQTAISSTSEKSWASEHVGVIVGSVIGGVIAIALVIIAILLFMRRHRRNKADYVPPPQYELGGERQVTEMQYPEKRTHTELYAHEAATEIGRSSVYVPPAELPAEASGTHDKKADPGQSPKGANMI